MASNKRISFTGAYSLLASRQAANGQPIDNRPAVVANLSSWPCGPLEIGDLRRKACASDFAGLFPPNALSYFWRLLNHAAAAGERDIGRDRVVLRACAYRQRTKSGAPDHRRFSSTQSG